ncbi:dynein axonemal intermediate chain 3-like [Anopheles maculipalpis]|uniref:dynein axonemal intermediate chain 3-like n=1 Tax=Anopheles maculipalpis TaxID=1496333 RepID=UPI00215952B7|nr:dynein axonemal intermediate chain 3-like [Anopheles maculipalpis]
MSKITQDISLKDGFFDDEEFEVIFGFDDQEAWTRLRSFSNTTQVLISSQSQAEYGILLGKNITDEHPWKEIKKETFQKFLSSRGQTDGNVQELLQRLEPGSSLLIEYLPDQSTAHEDAFLVYLDVAEINEASEIVRNLELFQRLKLNLLTEKRMRQKWCPEGADLEIAKWTRLPSEPNVDTEAQSVLPIRRTDQTVSTRGVSDVRDGYVELVPFKWKPINFPRRLTDRAIQVRPQAYSRLQQTEPTFLSHAATQYQLDVADSKIDPSLISSTWLLNAAESLSQEARFNLIELYSNEYDCISQTLVPSYRTPQIDEVLSFMNRALCIGRSVCSMDWHPELSGVFVASYTFETLSKHANKQHNQSEQPFGDALNRMTFEKCTVLLWSFEDSLEPLLELKTIREVTAVSFCPYDGELLVGGLSNGQIVLWDMKGELERVEQAKKAALESSEYRKQIRQLMEYPEMECIDREVNPAAVSSLEHSSRGAITCIKWLPRNYFCTTTGHLKPHAENLYRFMVSTSLDGSVCFWDLEFTLPALQKMVAASKTAQLGDKTAYQRVNNLFFPTFRLICAIPILATVIDEAIYLSMPQERVAELTKRVKHQQEPVATSCEMCIKLGSFTGQLIEASWEGYDFEQGALVNDELVKVTHAFSPIHDGPILALERNNICRTVFLSIGENVLAIWSETESSSPVFWRKKPVKVTACRWSLDRVSVFFVGLSNGDFEIWDMSLKTFRATVCMNLGSEALTTISLHRLASARNCLAVADSNANIRIFKIAAAFVKPLPDEEETFSNMIQHELARKARQTAWEKGYFRRNVAIIEAKIQAEIDARERKHQEEAKANAWTTIDADKTKKMLELEKRMPLSERLEQKYQAKHFETLLRKLMARRNVSPERMAQQMRPEVERRKYNAEKRDAIAANISLAKSDFTNVHKLLRPVEKAVPIVDESDREEKVGKYRADIADYRRIESEAGAVLRAHYLPELDSFVEVLMKSKERRDKVCVKVGTNMQHLLSYEKKRSLRRLGVAPRTLLQDLNPIIGDEDGEEGKEEFTENV